ncbi:MAG: alpha/beta hydrolase [Acidimicrobiales bacterium]
MDWEHFEVDSTTGGWMSGEGAGLALLVHGGPGMSDYMDGVADEVAEALPDHRVARYQQRGLAPSTTEGPLTVAQLVDDLWAVVDHLGGASVVLVGHSWGGHLAMHAAVAHPELTSGMVLLDSLGAVGDGGQSTMQPVIASRLNDAAITEVLGLLEQDLSSVEAGTRQVQLVWPGYFADPANAPEPPPISYDLAVGGAVMADAGSLLAAGVLEAALPMLAVPSVHVIGRASPIDPDANRATAALCRNAVVVELDTGHFPWIEQPGCVTAAVRRLPVVPR